MTRILMHATNLLNPRHAARLLTELNALALALRRSQRSANFYSHEQIKLMRRTTIHHLLLTARCLRRLSSRDRLSLDGVCVGLRYHALDDLFVVGIENLGESIVKLGLGSLEFCEYPRVSIDEV